MDNSVTSINTIHAQYLAPQRSTRPVAQDLRALRKDTVQFGAQGTISNDQAMHVVLERAMARLRAVVDEARAALGIPEGEVIDTSPEATADRIAEFALGAFDRWRENHAELGEDDAREQFVDFIGGAIMQGIDEARGILTAINALTPEVDGNINTTWDIIQQRLNDFASGG